LDRFNKFSTNLNHVLKESQESVQQQYYHTSAAPIQKVLLQSLPPNVTLVQVQFARTPDPNTVYPFTFRFADRSQPPFGPATISIESGTLSLQMYPGAYTYGSYDAAPPRWTMFNDGYYRASVYVTKPDFDRWLEAVGRLDRGLITFQHHFNSAPQCTGPVPYPSPVFY
jgi:hypothetical protein